MDAYAPTGGHALLRRPAYNPRARPPRAADRFSRVDASRVGHSHDRQMSSRAGVSRGTRVHVATTFGRTKRAGSVYCGFSVAADASCRRNRYHTCQWVSGITGVAHALRSQAMRSAVKGGARRHDLAATHRGGVGRPSTGRSRVCDAEAADRPDECRREHLARRRTASLLRNSVDRHRRGDCRVWHYRAAAARSLACSTARSTLRIFSPASLLSSVSVQPRRINSANSTG